jgi:hypothetical protein
MTPENCSLLLFCVFNYSLKTIHYSLHFNYSLTTIHCFFAIHYSLIFTSVPMYSEGSVSPELE